MATISFEQWRKEKFDPWRQRKMSSWLGRDDMHFHRLSEECSSVVINLLQNAVRQRILASSDVITLKITPDDFALILDFLEQFRFAYIHPRSTSHRIEMLRSENVTANP